MPAELLAAIEDGDKRIRAPVYIRNWRRDYDYLYVVGPIKPNLMPDILEELSVGSRLVLYKIHK